MNKSCNRILEWWSLTVFITLILSSCTSHEADIQELHRKYMEASMNHDIETLRAMMAEDIVWELELFTFQGIDEALGPHEYDAGIENNIEYSNVVVRGDTVEFELIETNEISKTFGMNEVRQFPRFIFKDGLVHRKELWKRSTDKRELSRRVKPFHGWIRKKLPGVMKTFFNSEKKFIHSRETGQLYLQLLREWREETGKESIEPHGENQKSFGFEKNNKIEG